MVNYREISRPLNNGAGFSENPELDGRACACLMVGVMGCGIELGFFDRHEWLQKKG